MTNQWNILIKMSTTTPPSLYRALSLSSPLRHFSSPTRISSMGDPQFEVFKSRPITAKQSRRIFVLQDPICLTPEARVQVRCHKNNERNTSGFRRTRPTLHHQPRGKEEDSGLLCVSSSFLRVVHTEEGRKEHRNLGGNERPRGTDGGWGTNSTVPTIAPRNIQNTTKRYENQYPKRELMDDHGSN